MYGCKLGTAGQTSVPLKDEFLVASETPWWSFIKRVFSQERKKRDLTAAQHQNEGRCSTWVEEGAFPMPGNEDDHTRDSSIKKRH